MNRKDIFGRSWPGLLGDIGVWALVGMTVLVSAEIWARFDDFVYEHVPFLASPSERDLEIVDEQGVRGRPNGRFQKWKLNKFGFRGPEIGREAPAQCRRVMILGASETFGLYESPDKEFPAQLRQRLARSGCVEVINAAVVGMELASMRRYWEEWASQFHPDLVLIYPTPHFYLNESVTRRAVGQAGAIPASRFTANASKEFSSRFVLRLHNVFHYPYFIQKRRDRRRIANQVEGKDAAWFFHEVPQDRLRMFGTELRMLVASIKQKGATPVLMAHAFRAALPLRGEDYRDLEAHRVFMPRAMPEVIAQFEFAANEEIRRISSEEGLALIDLARAVDGCRQCFADLVHFTDFGAGVVADEIARQIQPMLVGGGSRSSAPARSDGRSAAPDRALRNTPAQHLSGEGS